MNATGKMINDWLRVEGYQPEQMPENPAYAWAARFKIQDWTHVVHQPRDVEEAVVLQSKWVFNQADLELLKALPAKRALEILWEIRMRLVLRPTEFLMLPPRDGFPQGFTFSRQVSYDGGLTRHHFLEAVRELHRTELFVAWVVVRERELRAVPDDPNLRLTLEPASSDSNEDSDPAHS